MAEASPNTVRSTSMVGRLGLPTSTQHIKSANKATALRELQRSQKMHLIKLENMKPSIDMKQPKSYPHVQFNAKRMQMEAERNSAIGARAPSSHALEERIDGRERRLCSSTGQTAQAALSGLL